MRPLNTNLIGRRAKLLSLCAAELGELALRVGGPAQVTPLLFGLRFKDAKLADALFARTLEASGVPPTPPHCIRSHR